MKVKDLIKFKIIKWKAKYLFAELRFKAWKGRVKTKLFLMKHVKDCHNNCLICKRWFICYVDTMNGVD